MPNLGAQFIDDPDERRAQNQARVKVDPDYAKHYKRGRAASVRFGRSSGSGLSPLERADSRGEPNAWYDGYMDHANG